MVPRYDSSSLISVPGLSESFRRARPPPGGPVLPSSHLSGYVMQPQLGRMQRETLLARIDRPGQSAQFFE